MLALGNHLVDNGFTVAIPSLFGTPGPRHAGGPGPESAAWLRGREFAAFALNKERPVTHYLRALARDLNAATPGKGVGSDRTVFHRWFRAGRRGGRQRAGSGAQPALGPDRADPGGQTRSRILRRAR